MITNVFQDGSQAKTLMWQKIGSQADAWKQGLVQLSPSQSTYQVRKQNVSTILVLFVPKDGVVFLTDFCFTYFAERLSLREYVAQVTKATSHWTTYLSKTINVHLLVRHILVLVTIESTGMYKKYVFMSNFVDKSVLVHHKSNQSLDCLQMSVDIQIYYTTQAVRGPITKINQSKCSIAGPIFSKYWTGHCPE